jgi:hypothetical protein
VRLVQVEKRYVKKKLRKYSIKHPSSAFTNVDIDGEERPQCLNMKILAVDSMKPNSLANSSC